MCLLLFLCGGERLSCAVVVVVEKISKQEYVHLSPSLSLSLFAIYAQSSTCIMAIIGGQLDSACWL